MNEILPASRRRRATIVTAIVVALSTAAAAWWALTPGPQKLFEQGLAAARINPTTGERLLRRAVEKAGGRYPDAQVALCRVLAQRGAWDEASTLFATVDKQVCRADLMVAFGREAIRAERRSAGIEALEAAAERGSPASVAAFEILSPEYHEAGQIDKETAALYQLARLDSDNPARWQALVVALQGQRMLVECEAALREALEQDLPGSSRRDFEYLLVRMLIWKGDAAECRRRLDDLKKLGARSFHLSVTEIELCRLEGRLDEAQRLAAALSPDAASPHTVYYLRGALHFELDEFQEAVRDLERAVELQPTDENSHFKLSETYRLLKRGELADQHAKIAAQITANRKRLNEMNRQRSENPKDPAIARQLAELHAELGDDKSAQYWNEQAKRLGQSRSNLD